MMIEFALGTPHVIKPCWVFLFVKTSSPAHDGIWYLGSSAQICENILELFCPLHPLQRRGHFSSEFALQFGLHSGVVAYNRAPSPLQFSSISAQTETIFQNHSTMRANQKENELT